MENALILLLARLAVITAWDCDLMTEDEHPTAAFVVSRLQPFAERREYNRRLSLQGCPKDKGAGILAHIEWARLIRTLNMAGKAKRVDQGLN